MNWDKFSQTGYSADFVAAAPAQLPDLVISALSVSSTSVQAGSQVTVNVTVKNNGPGPAGASTTRVRLATSTTITTSDPLLDTFMAQALTSGQSASYTRTVTIPSGTSAGGYYMGATANANSGVQESAAGQNNNQRTTPITVTTQPQLPDLVISSMSVSSTSVQAGTQVTVNLTVLNNGPGSAASSLTRIRLASGTTITTSDPLLESFTAQALAPGQSAGYASVVTIPSGTTAGNYYMGATANANSAVQESSAGQNNNQRTTPITVANASTPALSITSTAFNPSTATVGVGYGANSPVSAMGGQTPYTWSATGLPNGMGINPSSGAVFGTPTVAGTYDVNVTVRDSSNPQKTASKTLVLSVSNASSSDLSITSAALNPSTATVGVGYGAASPVTATGGQTPYSWSAVGFPNGMSINSSSGAPFGTPTFAGTFNVTVTVRDSSSPQKTASKTLPLNVIGSAASPPTVQTQAATPSVNSAVLNARITNDGGGPILERRFDWGITPDGAWPSTNYTSSVTLSGTDFSYNLIGLTSNATYYFRSWAKNANGWAQSTIASFRTGSSNVQPDLVPSNVTVIPGSINISDTVTISLTVTNQGDGTAGESKTRLRINSSATNTAATDISLGDIDTPVVPGHSSVFVQKQVRVSGISPGNYYVWVSLDNTTVTNQSDGTNDYARSPLLSVIAEPGASDPVIQSVNQQLNSDASVTLTAVAVGGALTYSWQKNGVNVYGEHKSSLRATTTGDYVVFVTSGASTVHSDPVRVIFASMTAAPAKQPKGGILAKWKWIGKEAPTVVITHGWQQTSDEAWTTGPSNIRDLADAVSGRLPNANVLVYLWRDAYTAPLMAGQAFAGCASAGSDLAAQLLTLFGGQPSNSFQFVGHSFGSFVNAYAVGKLPWHVDQFTILDAPINPEAWIGVYLTDPRWFSGIPRAGIFYKNLGLDNAKVEWVDNYVAGLPYVGFQFGAIIGGSAPSGGKLVFGVNHSSIVDGFYIPTVQQSGSDGFNHSSLARNGVSDLAKWQPGSLSSRVLDDLVSLAIPIAGNVSATVELVGRGLSEVWQLRTKIFSPSGGLQPLTNQIGQQTTADSAIQFELGVPQQAESLRFSFKFAERGDGDWVSVSFNGAPLFTFLGSSFVGDEYNEIDIPVSNIAGQMGVFTVTLHAVSTIPAEFRIGDIRFAEAVSSTRLSNISTRLTVGSGDDATIGGFIVTGTEPKKLMVRAIGPSVSLEGTLKDPTLEIYNSSNELLASNNNWRDSENVQEIISSTIAPTNDLESAFLGTLNPGAYTAVVRGSEGATGLGLVEVYDLSQNVDSTLANISTRGFVATDDNVMIGGTIITGSTPVSVLFRAIGPSLANFGLSNTLQDPELELYNDQGALIASNDNWVNSIDAGAIMETTISPSDERESAILQNLPPAAYTAIVRGSGNATGVALVEAYHLVTKPTPTPQPTSTPVPTPTVVTLFQDNFDDNAINSAKWTIRGSAVAEAGGQMQISTNATDNGGVLTSQEFSLSGRGPITMTRSVMVHYGNNYAIPTFVMKIGNFAAFHIHYANMSYDGSPHRACYGTTIGATDGNPHSLTGVNYVSAPIPTLWDTWYNEKVMFTPETGNVQYFVNGELKIEYNVGVLPTGAGTAASIEVNAWGWYTGHQHFFDDLVVTQTVTN